MPINCSVSRLVVFIDLPVVCVENELPWSTIMPCQHLSESMSWYSRGDRSSCDVSGTGSPVKSQFTKWGDVLANDLEPPFFLC